MVEAERETLTKGAIRLERPRGRVVPLPLERVPWWALILLMAGLVVTYTIATSAVYQETLRFLARGVVRTLQLSVSAYAIALVLGLIAGLARVSKRPVFYTLGTLYVEVIRGIPLLVQLIYIAFVVAPALGIRNDMARATLGLGIGYGAYLAEIYRAGIESIPRGQMEAALSLGMTYGQAMRYVILPQAIRVILPPLGNDFIAMLKDSSLASAIAVSELTHSGRLLTARTFRAFETYNMVALLYLMMTLLGSLGVRILERYTSGGKQ